MHSDFRVDTQTSGRVTTLALGGELDLVSTPTLEQELDRANRSEADVIVVDLRELDFMDSTGLHLLIRAQQRAHETGREFAVIKGGEQVQRLLSLTGVADVVRIVESPEELLEAGRASDAP